MSMSFAIAFIFQENLASSAFVDPINPGGGIVYNPVTTSGVSPITVVPAETVRAATEEVVKEAVKEVPKEVVKGAPKDVVKGTEEGPLKFITDLFKGKAFGDPTLPAGAETGFTGVGLANTLIGALAWAGVAYAVN